ncbi:MAG: L-2-hydroxyglutarate oxidase [Simkaniaceae bacterium]|nr:L-2-hydroxyglutarate oxidase [Simkaniaceae bacterium]
MHCDVVIIGGGIVGLATALQLLKNHPHLQVTILEKEKEVGLHQTGRNSGVIHSGIYYKPGSLKAQNCTKGRELLLQFLQEHQIPHRKLHKLIVATEDEEIPRLETLYERGRQNGIGDISLIGQEEIKEWEPHLAARKAILLPSSYIVDYKKVADFFAGEIQKRGGTLLCEVRVHKVQQDKVITSQGEVFFKKLINCAGLYADQIAAQVQPHASQIIPFRGEYYNLSQRAESYVRGLIYPVPDPRYPFLGIHLTPMMKGGVEAGPNAVLALAREGYSWRQINIAELLLTARFPGFWKMSKQHWKTGLYEIARSASKRLFLRDLRKLLPMIEYNDLASGGTGVRAQAIDHTGKLLDDFSIVHVENQVHVLNAPSPAATSSLAIGESIMNALFEGSKI